MVRTSATEGTGISMTTPQDPSQPYGAPQEPSQPYGTPPPPPAYSGGDNVYGQPQQSQYAGAQLASWGRRVGGALLDALIFGVPLAIIDLIIGSQAVSNILGFLLTLTLGYLNGALGQTPGKRIVGIKVVRDADGALLGGGLGIVRAICHILDVISCLVGYLWPLWDNKNQTFADKVMSTVVLKI
jgi:uncharacterized RDD family membrane protein YckC